MLTTKGGPIDNRAKGVYPYPQRRVPQARWISPKTSSRTSQGRAAHPIPLHPHAPHQNAKRSLQMLKGDPACWKSRGRPRDDDTASPLQLTAERHGTQTIAQIPNLQRQAANSRNVPQTRAGKVTRSTFLAHYAKSKIPNIKGQAGKTSGTALCETGARQRDSGAGAARVWVGAPRPAQGGGAPHTATFRARRSTAPNRHYGKRAIEPGQGLARQRSRSGTTMAQTGQPAARHGTPGAPATGPDTSHSTGRARPCPARSQAIGRPGWELQPRGPPSTQGTEARDHLLPSAFPGVVLVRSADAVCRVAVLVRWNDGCGGNVVVTTLPPAVGRCLIDDAAGGRGRREGRGNHPSFILYAARA